MSRIINENGETIAVSNEIDISSEEWKKMKDRWRESIEWNNISRGITPVKKVFLVIR